MSERSKNGLTRRDFLGKTAVVAGAASLFPGLFPAAGAKVAAPAAGYHSLTTAEATFTEAMVNALCPADQLTPDGATCGLASFIDGQLAGEFGAQPSPKWPLSNKEFFKTGVAAANEASLWRSGVPFHQLHPSDARVFLAEIASGQVRDTGVSLAFWHKQVVDPLLVQAAFSGPVYLAYDNSVFTKIFG